MAITAGRPDEWKDFERRHARFLELFPSLMETCDRVVSRTFESDKSDERLVFLLGRHVPEDFNEILLLCTNGYGLAAIKLLRSMFERVVTMMYLIRNPEKSGDFIDWLAMERQRTLNHLRDAGDDPSKYLDAEKLQEVEDHYRRVKDRFPKKQHSWAKLDLKSMARHVGIGQMYLALCHWPTLQVHTTLLGMSARVERTAEAAAFKVGAQRDQADNALLGAHTCLLLALDEHVRYFKLNVDTAPLKEAYKSCWHFQPC